MQYTMQVSRMVIGYVGPKNDVRILKYWNALFAKQGMHAFCDFYRTETRADLELRLSEMFTLGRRGYILAEQMQSIVRPLLDRADGIGPCNTIVNEGGVLCGTHLDTNENRFALWFGSASNCKQVSGE